MTMPFAYTTILKGRLYEPKSNGYTNDEPACQR